MLETFLITFRETLEAALVVGIVLAYLSKTGRERFRPHVYAGLSLAVAFSLLAAVVLQLLYQGQETRGQQLFEGTVMLIASVFVVTMVIWMWRSAKNIKKSIEGKVESLAGGTAMTGIGILLFVFLMVFREGAETILFLYAVLLRSGSGLLSNLSGAALGLVTAILFGVLIIRGSFMIDLKKFFTVTGGLLMFIVAGLIATSIHEFQEARLIPPASTGLFWDVQIWLASPTSTLITLLPIVIVPSLMIVLARDRRALAEAGQKSGLLVKATAAFLTVFVVMFAVAGLASQVEGYDPEPLRVASAEGEVRIPAASVSENITKYLLTVDGVDVRFMLVRAGDGTIKSALDACRICGPAGFEQVEDTVVCARCGVETAIDDIGLDTSCNPIPLGSALDSGDVVIPAENFLKDMYIWTEY